eukprot:TRINITY_DN1597_c0_g10_i1.p1 TRINITY_DN1597_c0_g10~~TRINITY_DN1597_c0_g10_i1.p1  ORF type:complete len:116 (+),score=19.36 TRINITY_DN1597_c0_g10_i1:138-485(+)
MSKIDPLFTSKEETNEESRRKTFLNSASESEMKQKQQNACDELRKEERYRCNYCREKSFDQRRGINQKEPSVNPADAIKPEEKTEEKQEEKPEEKYSVDWSVIGRWSYCRSTLNC